MKCIINGQNVNAELVEDCGYYHDPGMYVKEVLFQGKLYKVVSEKRRGVYREWTVNDRLVINKLDREK